MIVVLDKIYVYFFIFCFSVGSRDQVTFVFFFTFVYSVLTPYYKEDVLYSEEELNKENEDGISILFYLQRIYPGERLYLVILYYVFVTKFSSLRNGNVLCYTEEWSNFSERVNDPKRTFSEKDKADQLREWVSYRGQTLSRTGILSECCRIFFTCMYVFMRSLMYWKKSLLLC